MKWLKGKNLSEFVLVQESFEWYGGDALGDWSKVVIMLVTYTKETAVKKELDYICTRRPLSNHIH